MEARTFMLWFQIDKAILKDNPEELLSRIQSLPSFFFPGHWTSVLHTRLDDLSYLIIHVNIDGSHAITRLYSSGFMTFDLQCQTAASSNNNNRPQLMSMIRDRVERMKKHLGKLCTNIKCLYCPIFRSPTPPWPYVVTGDERLLQRDFTELVYETDSQWQNIKIYKSQQCGNVLYLDDDVMLGESDLLYSETLLGLERNDFTDKTVLILGGGDGGLLNELVSRTKPASVTMVEIDEEVIKASRTYMRKVCGCVLDNYEGRNYKIIIGDCVKYLNKSITAGEEFDYIVNDLTEYAVDSDKYNYEYDMDFACEIMDLVVQVLGRNGRYLARGNTLSTPSYYTVIEKHMARLKLDYKVISRYIPSFQEMYCFIEAWKKDSTS